MIRLCLCVMLATGALAGSEWTQDAIMKPLMREVGSHVRQQTGRLQEAFDGIQLTDDGNAVEDPSWLTKLTQNTELAPILHNWWQNIRKSPLYPLIREMIRQMTEPTLRKYCYEYCPIY